MTRTPRLLAGLAALSLLVAACGDDADDATETTAATTEAPATETTEAAAPETTEAPAPETTEAAAPETTEAPTPETTEAPEPSLGSVLDVAAEAGTFTTLLAAVDAAGLTETLESLTDMTLLAPTDEAFAALGQETIDALLADPATLAGILQGHVLAVGQDAAMISIFANVLAINGVSWPVVAEGETVTIGGATVVAADVPADNGIIHVIDTVLVPAPEAAPAG
jgi:uncharacterized surface protein with fasciclin (FAS1) repeats